MNKEELDRKLECLLPGGVLREEPMSKHTTFRIGGPAEWYVCPTADVLPQILALAKESGVPLTVIGNGSNLLVADAGIRGIVLEIGRAMERVELEPADAIGNPEAAKRVLKPDQETESECKAEPGQETDAKSEENTRNVTYMRIGAGTLLSKAARVAADAGLSGLEFAAGIPGSLGGAVVMNAGAYGGQMKDILVEVTVLTPEGEFIVFSKKDEQDCSALEENLESQLTELKQYNQITETEQGCCNAIEESHSQRADIKRDDGMDSSYVVEYRNIEELDLSYRHSIIPERHYVVVEAVVALTPAPKEEIQAQMADLRKRRIDKQPLEYPSAGSTFKRPEGYFAGKLIEDAGLKGYTVGGAQVSPKHSGFVINTGSATATDVRQLIVDVQERVMQQFGVQMEPEVRMLGDFEESMR